ncbi:MAG: ARMT1-like domain-containing protein [Nitrososphaerota archaeon]
MQSKPWLYRPVTASRCAVCILQDVYSGAEAAGIDEEKRFEVLRQTLSMLHQDFHVSEMPSTYITRAHRILKNVSGMQDPFRHVREVCNRVGIRLAAKLAEEAAGIDDCYERFRYLAKWAVAANAMDIRMVGAGYILNSNLLSRRLRQVYEEELAVDELEEIFQLLPKTKHVLYVLDNVGEVAVDRLLVEELQAAGITVTVAVRGGPLTSDVTIDDAVAAGFDHSSMRLITTGPDTLGITFDEMSEEFRDETEQADLVIGKGQANFYAFCQNRSVFHGKIAALLRTKCEVISSLFGCRGNIGIAVLI